MASFKAAVRKVKNRKQAAELKKDGYYLNSGLGLLNPGAQSPEKWILTFYNQEKNLVAEVTVNSEVIFKPAATPINATPEKLRVGKINVPLEKALKIAAPHFEKYKKPLSQILVTIQNEKPVWRINYITKTLEIVMIEMSAENGKILGSKIENLTKVV